ncbi:unnamed protein product, partial [Polarella glacialis]
FRPRELAALLWAFAALGSVAMGAERDLLFQAASAKVLTEFPRLERWGPWELSNLAWAFATAGQEGGSSDGGLLFEAVQAAARPQLQSFTPQGLSNLAWAMATAGAGPEHLDFLAELTYVATKRADLKPQELATLAWALARSGFVGTSLEVLVRQGISQAAALKPQELSQLAWAIAKAGGPSAAHLLHELLTEGVSLDRASLEPQVLSNLAWACATTELRDQSLLAMLGEQAALSADTCEPQHLSNLAWSFAVLGASGGQQEVFEALASASARSLPRFQLQGLANLAWALATAAPRQAAGLLPLIQQELTLRLRSSFEGLESKAGCCALGREGLGRLGRDVVSATWALHFAGVLDQELLTLVRPLLAAVGRALDDAAQVQGALAPLQVSRDSENEDTDETEPAVVLELADRLVLHKPPHWQVEPSQGQVELSQGSPRMLLDYLRSLAPRCDAPIFWDRDHRHGFLHRLDVPSSGLLLVAKTYEAYFDLQLQLSLNELERDYVVLCHGWIAATSLQVDAPVLWNEHVPGPSKVSDQGRPSISQLKVLAHTHRQQAAYSLVAVRIQTGRRHQIRVHTAHIGHPTVSDGKYTALDQFLGDCSWCPRNFLHRCRLGFRVGGAGGESETRRFAAESALPADLRAVLVGELSARSGSQAELQLSSARVEHCSGSGAAKGKEKSLGLAKHGQVVGGAQLDWGNLFFQYRDVHCHVKYEWKDGEWSQGEEVKDPYMKMHVMANVFHYGQALFEGQKAFHCKDGKVRIFNDCANYARMMSGCERMGMPSMPQEMFHDAIDRATRANLDFVPPYGSNGNGALYLRPFMVGSGAQLGLGPSHEFIFVVVACPVGSYYKTAGLTPIPCTIMDSYDRAAPLGVGHCKCAGNYAADIVPAKKSKEKGFPIGLYLDAKEHRYVEEFNTSNFVAITKSNVYLTPDSCSVLGSVTNKCLEDLARDMGLTVERRPIDFEAEVDTFTEVGAVGTAVIITPIESIARGDKKFTFGAPVTLQKLHDTVRAVQVGEAPDTHNWLRELAL